MKLRNKITNEIYDAEAREDGIYLKTKWSDEETWHKCTLHCLADNWEYYAEPLIEDWEDYKPKEPKITDPEWCHVVRKWYELSDLEEGLTVIVNPKKYVIIGWRKEDVRQDQQIDIPLSVMECDKDSYYTIAELCG